MRIKERRKESVYKFFLCIRTGQSCVKKQERLWRLFLICGPDLGNHWLKTYCSLSTIKLQQTIFFLSHSSITPWYCQSQVGRHLQFWRDCSRLKGKTVVREIVLAFFTKQQFSLFPVGCKVRLKNIFKMKGGIGEKQGLLIANNLTSICCVYEEKIVKNDSCWRT